jgi:hypothetical protein
MKRAAFASADDILHQKKILNFRFELLRAAAVEHAPSRLSKSRQQRLRLWQGSSSAIEPGRLYDELCKADHKMA